MHTNGETAQQECAGCPEKVSATYKLCFNPSGVAYVCRNCQHWHFGFPENPGICHSCGGKDLYESNLDQPLCPECTKKLEEAEKIVQQGGAYWSCTNCHSEGVLRPNHLLAIKMRITYQVRPPNPILLNMKSCPYCKTKAKSPCVDTPLN